MPKGEPKANQCSIQEPSIIPDITDVYISIFFDGTGNNMYEQIHKAKAAQEKMIVDSITYTYGITYSLKPDLFKSKASDKYDEIFQCRQAENHAKEDKTTDLEEYGMDNYEMQRRQAEYEYKIEDTDSEKRKSQDDPDNMGGWKYSNIAILRSLTKKTRGDEKEENKIKGINYNLYIEGSGQKWGVDSDVVALGMGVRREGVVGLVSKAVVFVQKFVDSVVDHDRRKDVNVHFAVFGFSRGSTCGRLFSYLVAEDPNNLPRKNEFKQYLPKSLFGDDGKIHFLDDYKNGTNVTVDFLGIYDTVSSIGFLQKNDKSTNYGISRFFECPKEKGKYLHFDSSSDEEGTQWYINILHGSQLKDGEPLMYDTPDGPVPNWNAVEQAATDGFWGDAKWNFHRFNAHDYGLFSPKLDNVKHTYHICAMDEYRENFALVDLGSKEKELNDDCSEVLKLNDDYNELLKLNDHCSEVFMPGCHSDIGGGLMYNDNLEKYTLRLKIAGKDTLINVNPDPLNLEMKPLSQDILFELGWLTTTTGMEYKLPVLPNNIPLITPPKDNRVKKEKYRNPIKDITINTPGSTTYIYDNEKKIEFERFVQEGYSNVTLNLMMEKAIVTLGNMNWPERFKPFSGLKLPSRFAVPGDLLSILFEAKTKSVEGKRNFVIPEIDEYKRLRSNYLHFSCTEELNLEHCHLKASEANIGNPPNWRKTINGDGYLLCRLIYRGDKEDAKLHYIDDYKNEVNS